MNSGVEEIVSLVRSQVQQAATFGRYGRVVSVSGLIVESEGPNVGLGELCVLRSQRNAFEVLAEVVGFRAERILLMALGDVGGLHVGCETVAIESLSLPVANDLLLGRVLDALGRPMDEGAALSRQRQAWVAQTPPPPPVRPLLLRALALMAMHVLLSLAIDVAAVAATATAYRHCRGYNSGCNYYC